MTLIGHLAKRGSLESTNTPLTDTSLLNWMSGPKSDSGVSVSEQRVLGSPAYYRALTVTAGALAALPVKTYKVGTRERIARRTVLDDPNPPSDLDRVADHHLPPPVRGNASRKVRTARLVRQVWPIHPGCVRVETIDPTSENPAGKLFLVTRSNGTEERSTPLEVMHLPHEHGWGGGVRPMVAFRQSLGLAIAGDDSTARFFGNGSRLRASSRPPPRSTTSRPAGSSPGGGR